MFEIGRLVLKVAGRDAGKVGVIISPVQDKKILVDGLVRRKNVSTKHIIPLKATIKVKENETKEVILKELEKLGYKIEEKYTKKITSEKPKAEKKESSKKTKTKKTENKKVEKSKTE